MTHYLERSRAVLTATLNSDNELVLLEFKCPFKRQIAINCIPLQYSDQIQTGLALSGESVNKGLFVDNYFRICSLKQIEPSPAHNPILNGGKVYQSKGGSTLAWGICYLYSKQKLNPKQKNIIDLGSAKSSKLFEKIMTSIAEKEIFFTDKGKATYFPVAVLAWKPLNITEIWEQKKPNFLEKIQKPVECFHKNLGKLKNTLNDFVYEDENHAKPTIIENKGDDTEFLEALLRNSIA